MKRLVTLFVLGLAITAYSVIGVKQQIARPAGVNTAVGNYMQIVHDSSDTHNVDTFWSDTITIPDTSTYVKIIYSFGGVQMADSANDSVTIEIQTLMTTGSLPSVVIFNDSFNLVSGSTTNAEAIRRVIKFDTLLENKIYFRTITTDSFITDVDGFDTSLVNLAFYLLSKRSPGAE